MPFSTNNDLLEYSYGSYPEATPERLYTIAKLFGCQAKDFRQAKVLELGCARGHNLIPLAAKYPKSYFVGIDTSEAQIELGRKMVKELGLKNVRLECMDLLEFNAKGLGYDYVIVQGIFSWVDEKTRGQILKIAKRNITPEGLVYISYNVLPGWNFTKTLRDLMMFHTRKVNSLPDKAEQAKQVLQVIAQKMLEKKNHYSTFILGEMSEILQLTNEKLLLDHLEKINSPDYVYDFVRRAEKHGLSYLSDAIIYNNHFHHIIPFSKDEMENVLRVGEYVELMQESDFLLNRKFRRTILCDSNQKINRAVAPEALEKFYVYPLGRISVDKTVEAKCKEREVLIGLIEVLGKFSGRAIHFTDLRKLFLDELLVATKVAEEKSIGEQKKNGKETFNKMIMLLYHKGCIGLSSEPWAHVTKVSDRPEVNNLVRYYAKHFNFVINSRHETISVNPLEKALLQKLDGTKSIDSLTAELVKLVKEKKIPLPAEHKFPQENVNQLCVKLLERFVQSALLEG